MLYELSPGGVIASARRTARFRDQIEAAAEEYGVSADLMEAMVLLESAGRPEVIAGGSDPANASGLAQIVASTGIDLLGMPIDLSRSQELTTRITNSLNEAAKLRERGNRLAASAKKKQLRRARKLLFAAREAERDAEIARRERLRADPRFDPEAALDGMGRYLQIATERFGREDLAITSYHMGIGNLGDVIDAYVGPEQADMPARDLIDLLGLSYTQLFFDSSPTRNSQAWEILAEPRRRQRHLLLAGAGGARDHAAAADRPAGAQAARLAARQQGDRRGGLPPRGGHAGLRRRRRAPQDGLDAGELVAIPRGRGLGFEVGPQLGELAAELGEERSLYRALRPEALAALSYMAGRVQAITGKSGPKQALTVTSAVRDRAYQELLVGRNSEATSAYSLHTTGYSFDILRDYSGDRAGRGLPVRPRPDEGPRRDRLRGRAPGDPRHGLRSGRTVAGLGPAFGVLTSLDQGTPAKHGCAVEGACGGAT